MIKRGIIHADRQRDRHYIGKRPSAYLLINDMQLNKSPGSGFDYRHPISLTIRPLSYLTTTGRHESQATSTMEMCFCLSLRLNIVCHHCFPTRSSFLTWQDYWSRDFSIAECPYTISLLTRIEKH
jgi:hypothetical protein